jgi:hypothetical protein
MDKEISFLNNKPCSNCGILITSSKKLCNSCYGKYYRSTPKGKLYTKTYNDGKGRENNKRYLAKKNKKEQKYCECGSKVFAKGLCSKCYKNKSHNSTKKEQKYCECGSKVYAKGLCGKCYRSNRPKKTRLKNKPNRIFGLKDISLLLERGFTIKKSCEKLNLSFKDFYSSISEQEKTILKEKEIHYLNKINSLIDYEDETYNINEDFDLKNSLLRTLEVIEIMDSKFKGKKPIFQYTLDGVFICKYDSMSEAQISGISIHSISKICNGLQKPTKYNFMYDPESIKIPKEPLDNLLYFLQE